MNRNRWFAVAALAAAGIALAVLTVGGIGKNLVYYWGPTELHAAGDKAVGASIRLGGLVAEGSVKRGTGASNVEFDVIDRPGGRVHVRCTGVPPQMFRENIGVVVEGTMVPGGYFQSNRLMVSHNNEYKAPEKGHPVDRKELERMMKSVAEGESQGNT